MVAQYKQKQAEVNAEIKKQAQAFEQTKFAVGSYKALNAELGQARDTYRKLSEIDRNGAIGKNLLGNITQLDTKLKGIDASIGNYQRNVGNYSSALSGLGSIVGQYFSATALLAVGTQIVQQNAEISDSIANVAKTANASIPEINKLAEQLKFRDTRTSLADQLKIAEIGGQLGETADTLASFTAAIDVLGVALGDEFGNDVGRVTKEVAGLRNTLGDFKTDDAAGDILKLGNALNVLSASGNATAGVTTDIASRLAGLGTAFGLSAGQILGLSSRLDELNIPAERAGGSIQRVLNEVAKSPEIFAKFSGKSVPEFTKAVNDDLVGAFINVLDVIGKSDLKTTEFSKTLDALGLSGVGAKEIFSKLGKDTSLLVASIDKATDSLRNADSLYAEFNKKNQTLGAELAKLKNAFLNAFTNSTVQNGLASLVGGFRQMLTNITELFSPTQRLEREFGTLSNRVNVLQNELPKLLTRYEELRVKTNPTKEEQKELGEVIKRIGELTPTAIIEIDKYGTALSINAEKSREFLEAEKARLQFINKEQIKGLEEQIKRLNKVVEANQRIIKQGKETVFSGGGGGGTAVEVRLTPQRIAEIQQATADLSEEINGATAQLNFLKTGSAATAEQIKKDQTEVAALTEEQIKKIEDLSKESQRRAKERREKEREEIKRAAENIQRLQLDAIEKDFEGRKQRAEKEGEIAISALVGTPKQVETQTQLIKAQVLRSIEEINKEFQQARARALREIETLRQEITTGNADFQLFGAEREVSATTRFYEAQVEQIRLTRAKQFAELEKSFAKGELTATEFEQKRIANEQQFAQKRFDLQKFENAELAVAEANLLQKQLEEKEAAFQKEIAQIQRQKDERARALGLQVESGEISPSEGATGVQTAAALARSQELEAEQKFLEEKDKLQSDFALKQIERQVELVEQETALQSDKNEKLLQIQRQYQDALASSLGDLSAAFGEFITGQERDSKQFLKNILTVGLDALQKLILIQVAAATAQSFAQPDSVATFGATGAARAAVLTGLITAGFSGLKALVQSFEEGGSIPGIGASGEGEAQGASHANGGIKTTIGGQRVEIEGKEHLLKNGRETYVINKKSSQQFRRELRALHGNTNRFNPEKRAIAEQINMFKGFGRAFAPVRKFEGGGALSISPLNAPVLPFSNSQTTEAMLAGVNETRELIKAVNNRIDRLEVIADPLLLLNKGKEKATTKIARSL